MTSSPMTAPAEIVHLVELFKRNYDQYRPPVFTEATVRHQFIDPFVAANKQSLVQRVDSRSHAQRSSSYPFELNPLPPRLNIDIELLRRSATAAYAIGERAVLGRRRVAHYRPNLRG